MLHALSRPFSCTARWLWIAGCAGLLVSFSAHSALLQEDEDDSDSGSASVPAYRQANTVAVLTIEGMIDRLTLRSLEDRLKQARKDGADAIVLDLDTPGGEVSATLDITHLIKNDAPANTVAWVHPDAYSGGTIIALACREIVVSPNATFGDAAPINAMGGMMPIPAAERAKIETPLLAEVVDSARRNRYDENLVQSFISVGIELWLLENVDTGEQILVNRDEYTSIYGKEPPEQITSITPTGRPDQPTVNPKFKKTMDDLFGRKKQQQGGGLTPEEQTEQIEAIQELPSTRRTLTADDRDDWKLITQVVSDDRLLVVKTQEALHYGLARAVIANDRELKKFFGANTLRRYDQSWSVGLTRILTSWYVRGFLIVVMLIGFFLELAMPGVGLFGTAALIALMVLIGAPYLAGMAQWWDILLVLGGMILIGVELFIIPGFGLAGVAGVLCLLIGLVGTFVSSDIATESGQAQLLTGIGTTAAALFGGGVLIWLISRQFHSLPIFDKLILNTEIGSHNAAAAAAGAGLLGSMQQTGTKLSEGDIGIAATELRPGGTGEFNDERQEVNSVSGYIARGTPIRITMVGRFTIEVEEAEQ